MEQTLETLNRQLTNDALHGGGYMDAEGVANYFCISSRLVYKWIKTRGFPMPYKMGKYSRWSIGEVKEWETANLKKADARDPD